MAPSHRRARWLAPLALVACAFAVVAVVASGPGDSGADDQATSTAPASTTAARPASTAARRSGARRRYTIKPGDTLSGIAASTGVPLQTILRLNPGIDTRTLQAGQTIKLAP